MIVEIAEENMDMSVLNTVAHERINNTDTALMK